MRAREEGCRCGAGAGAAAELRGAGGEAGAPRRGAQRARHARARLPRTHTSAKVLRALQPESTKRADT